MIDRNNPQAGRLRSRGAAPGLRGHRERSGGAVRSRVTFLLAVAVLQGCYNYVTRRRAQLAPSTHVSVTLTESGSEELAQYLGPNVHVVRGRFLSATERGLAISVNAVETRRGDVLAWQGETVIVPGESVSFLEERRTAMSKTVLLAGASVAGFVAAYAAFGPGASGSSVTGSGSGSSPH